MLPVQIVFGAFPYFRKIPQNTHNTPKSPSFPLFLQTITNELTSEESRDARREQAQVQDPQPDQDTDPEKENQTEKDERE